MLGGSRMADEAEAETEAAAAAVQQRLRSLIRRDAVTTTTATTTAATTAAWENVQFWPKINSQGSKRPESSLTEPGHIRCANFVVCLPTFQSASLPLPVQCSQSAIKDTPKNKHLNYLPEPFTKRQQQHQQLQQQITKTTKQSEAQKVALG